MANTCTTVDQCIHCFQLICTVNCRTYCRCCQLRSEVPGRTAATGRASILVLISVLVQHWDAAWLQIQLHHVVAKRRRSRDRDAITVEQGEAASRVAVERRNVVARNEERGEVEQVDEDFVAITAKCRSTLNMSEFKSSTMTHLTVDRK